MAETAAVLGKNDETRHYVELAGKIKEAFDRKWLDRKLSWYGAGKPSLDNTPQTIGVKK